MQRVLRTCALLISICISAEAYGALLTIIPNDLSQGKFAQALQLMPDGKSMMGIAGDEVYRWSPNEGRITIGNLGPYILASGISGDGSTVIGRRVTFAADEAVRWTASTGSVALPAVPEFPYNPSPTYVSDDGSIIVGTAHNMYSQPIMELYILGETNHVDFPDYHSYYDVQASTRWDAVNGSEHLPLWTSPPFGPLKYLAAISADGSTVAGTIGGIPALEVANNPPILSPIPVPDFRYATVTQFSADGTTVAGQFSSNGSQHAYRWHVGESLEPLTNSSEQYSDVLGISGDGSTIVFRIVGQSEQTTFVWQQNHPVATYEQFFHDHGVELPLEGTNEFISMSRNGLVFYGYTSQAIQSAEGPITFQSTRWLVDLSAVPEPSSSLQIVFVAVSLNLLIYSRRRPSTSVARPFLL